VGAELAMAGHQLRLADIKPIKNPAGEAVRLDIADGPTVMRAMKRIEAVAHLAFGGVGPESELERIKLNFDVNAKGTYHLLWAAHQLGVKRFVYTSTLSVFGWTSDLGPERLTEASRPRPAEPYGLTKYFGEEACRLFAEHLGLSVVVLRLCNLCDDARWREAQQWIPKNKQMRNWRNMATHISDVARAIHLALTVPNLHWEIIHIAADNKDRLTTIRKAKDVLGFWPRMKLARCTHSGRSPASCARTGRPRA
jgi:uronate dehydrogenase